MSPESQRIAIAEACGSMKWSYAILPRVIVASVPDYLNDLNALREARAILMRPSKQVDYWHVLLEVVNGIPADKCMNNAYSVYDAMNASAPEHLEALVRTIGKWKEGEG